MVGIPNNDGNLSRNPNCICVSDEELEQFYKDVVVIGNGPSGIILSYFLAGNWPYYNGLGQNFNDMLHQRLMLSARKNSIDHFNTNHLSTKLKSIVEQDLVFLSQDLEGRSSNPISLLFDTLNHPQADLGLELPSLLNWEFSPENAIDHVVIGKGPPGGAWQSMDGNVLTISLGCWMELPGMNFRDWELLQQSKCCHESRASVSSVAQYYCDYVDVHGLNQYFLTNTIVTEVVQVQRKCLPEVGCDSELIGYGRRFRRHTIGGPLQSYSTHRNKCSKVPSASSEVLWRVKGYTLKADGYTPFTYITSNVVLASGASDRPNILGAPGEDLPFVLNSLNDLEQLLDSGELNESSDPILVVGAGLSAADAIIAARFYSVPVVHAFRRSVDDHNLVFKQLPQNMYPEYQKVYQMMKDSTGYEKYKVYEKHVIAEVSANKQVKLVGPTCCKSIKVSCVVACIGSQPNLAFMGNLENNLGIHPKLPIDCKNNPVAIDIASHESIRTPGLYALGPLIGENFVRFLQGGALAITSSINTKRNHQ